MHMMWLLCGLAMAEGPLAVVPLAVHATDPALAPVGDGLAEMLVSDLAGSVELVERTRIQAVIGELQLQQSGLVDPASAQQLGKLVGATWVVTGGLTQSGSEVRLDTRVVAVETGEVLTTATAEGPSWELFALERRVALGLLDGLSLSVSASERARLGGGAPPVGAVGGGRDADGAVLSVRKKGLFGGHVFVDGENVGRKLVEVALVPGLHEVALANKSGTNLVCWGVLEVPAQLTTRELCKAVVPGYGPFGSVLRGGVLSVREHTESGEELSVFVDGFGYTPANANLNLEVGSYQLTATRVWDVEEDGKRRKERETVCHLTAPVEAGVVTVVSVSVAGCEAVRSLAAPD
jgi:TolB-like protein